MQARIEAPVRQLNYFQKQQLKQAAEQKFNSEMLAVIATGYSDLGNAGVRSAWEMKGIRRILKRHQLLFSCISLLNISDEAIRLYNHAFSMGISICEATRIIGQYQDDVRGVSADTNRVNWGKKALRIACIYRKTMLDIANASVVRQANFQ